MFVLPSLSALFVSLGFAAAQTWSPTGFSVVNVGPSGARTYFYDSGTIVELSTLAVPSNPAGYNTAWVADFSLATLYNLVNVTPFTDIATIGYISPATGGLVVRLFYQTTDGVIRTAYHSGVAGDPPWSLDPVEIATVPLGSPLSAFQSNLNGVLPEILVIQYTDVNGLLTQRFTTTDGIDGTWSAPVTITTQETGVCT
ncbi:hypothetical protein DFH07DRAFT_389265 [Mycena maculata]|uniref:Fucose-specific lectin n=1 Tax=Mycena maculata TaxID=230809 RepID=A0AAD7KAM9_9AGAR|nr:hypothetical protein DFH07DRAFT_389265 [Mycena maculata]